MMFLAVTKGIVSVALVASLSVVLMLKPGQDDSTGSPADDTAETEEFLAELNRELFERYILHHDTETYAQTALDDYIFVAAIGAIETREEVLATADNLDIRSLTVTNHEFRHHGNTAVLVGTLDMEGHILGHNVDGKRRYMSVFVHLDGQWRLMARSLSPVVHPRQLFGAPD
jgi:hypothetical protein